MSLVCKLSCCHIRQQDFFTSTDNSLICYLSLLDLINNQVPVFVFLHFCIIAILNYFSYFLNDLIVCHGIPFFLLYIKKSLIFPYFPLSPRCSMQFMYFPIFTRASMLFYGGQNGRNTIYAQSCISCHYQLTRPPLSGTLYKKPDN